LNAKRAGQFLLVEHDFKHLLVMISAATAKAVAGVPATGGPRLRHLR
jgi:hypothetical protein